MLGIPRVTASSVDEAPAQATVRACRGHSRILSIQDTTSVSVIATSLREELASSGSPTGFVAHTAIAVDGLTGGYLGALDQQRWLCKGPDKRCTLESESQKWSAGDAAVRKRLEDMSNVITVADREADILPFLHEKAITGERFVIRAQHNRRLYESMGSVFEELRKSPVKGTRDIVIEQRGGVPAKGIEPGRKGRQRRGVTTNLQACQQVWAAGSGPDLRPMQVNMVRVSSNSMEWILITSESIETMKNIVLIVRDYEHRWIIEELHKVWKTGCRLEERPLQSTEAIEIMMAITLPIAGRIMTLHTAARSAAVDHDVTNPLSDDELQALWAATEKRRPYPAVRPTTAWAILAIARLGGWYDSKRTGRIGWQTLSKGWKRFMLLLGGWLLFKVQRGPQTCVG